MIDDYIPASLRVSETVRLAMEVEGRAVNAAKQMQGYGAFGAAESARLVSERWSELAAADRVPESVREADLVNRMLRDVAGWPAIRAAQDLAASATARIAEAVSFSAALQRTAELVTAGSQQALLVANQGLASDRFRAFLDLEALNRYADEAARSFQPHLWAAGSSARPDGRGVASAFLELERAARVAAAENPGLLTARSAQEAADLWKEAAAAHVNFDELDKSLAGLARPDSVRREALWGVLQMLFGLYVFLLAAQASLEMEGRLMQRFDQVERTQITADDVRLIIEETVSRTLLAKPAVVRARPAQLRAEPRSGSIVLTEAPPGVPLLVTGRRGKWVRVTYEDAEGPVEGWVLKKYLRVAGGAHGSRG